ncbi:hypothetical protein AAV35_013980 (plasmid) [Salimicrobium jeotgali]|uniref:Membrane-flanked domain-containing protein n=1 Tax=Salimicrobium jeotgali TaxID=1230341 RepID=K2H4I2_9BACI|nr:PH domain-containing protein [Salimicrobium jeotgali]AKG05849.1 hypothetical protein AAV35_013980 [Salimicrobium jeotgali]EKE30785.1 membrane-flanked domain-containing protein [Salimicrobium jeotgali]MBM7697618.1 putative membrane protein [Salimicrobium jeotgali]
MNNKNSPEHPIIRLHPLWILIQVGKSIKGLFFFSIFLFLILEWDFNIFSINVGKWLLITFLAYNIISILLQWRYFGYYLLENELFVRKGRFLKEARYVPYERVQGINQYTPLLHKLLGYTMLLLDLGANEKEGSIKLDMLTYKEAERIKQHLTMNGATSVKAQNDSSENGISISKSSLYVNHYEISKEEIVIGSLTSLKIVLFSTLIFSTYSDIQQFFSIESYVNQILAFLLSSWWITTLVLFSLVTVSIGYGLIKTYAQYGGFVVNSDNERIYIHKGKVNNTAFSIPKVNVQALTLKSTLIHKLLGIVKVKVISTNSKEDGEVLTSNILFPFIKEEKAKKIITEMLPKFRINNDMVHLPKSSIVIKVIRTSYIWIITSFLVYFYAPSFWYLALLITILTISGQIMNGLFSSYSLSKEHFQMKKCFFSFRTFFTPTSNIEELKYSNNLFQNLFGLSSLIITTRANPVKITKLLDFPHENAQDYCYKYQEFIYSREKSRKSVN